MGDATPSIADVSARHATDLVLSLVGVADARLVTDAGGAFLRLDVIPQTGVTQHAIRRNVISALRAALDVNVKPEMVNVVAELPHIDPPSRTRLVLLPGTNGSSNGKRGDGAAGGPPLRETDRQAASSPRGATRPTQGPRASDQMAAVSANGNLAYELALDDVRPMPQQMDTPEVALPYLESVELQRTAQRVNCRVIFAAGGERHAARAAGNAAPGVEVQLAARAAVDALRALGGSLTDLSLEGASLTHVGDRPHVIVAVQRWVGGTVLSLSGVAEVTESAERAAALATLRAATHDPEAER